MANYKVKSSSCFGGNKVFYSGEIFTEKEVSEQDLKHLLGGGFVEETEEEATTGFTPVEEIVIEHEEKKLLDSEIVIDEEEEEEEETEEKEIDPSELLKDKKTSKNSK